MPRDAQLALGLLAGVALDAAIPDPRRGHPVAVFGAAARRLERAMYADSRARGIAFSVACVGLVAAAARLIERRSGRLRPLYVAVGTWAVLGGRSLRAEADAMHTLLARGDLDAARNRVGHLASRDPAALDADGIARATVESVAENTCDAVVAPLLWGAATGLPGLLAYRAVNTLDAMVGYRSPHYLNFGWAAARLDDVANLVPARVTAVLVTLVAPAVGGDPSAAWWTAIRDGHRHPSPNSGYSEAAYAGALGLRLGGRNLYAGRVEERPTIGTGAPPNATDIPRAARLCAAVTLGAAGLAAGLAGRRRTAPC
jgi:adenosylcobinamide-phosphate synthase